jgi:ferritin-like metal-binding protein YciE
MPELKARDTKLIQYLNEAYGKEKELETALQAHIVMTTRPPYKKRLQQHLSETKRHARQVQQRIKQLGGRAELVPAPGPVGDAASAVASVANKAVAAAKGPLHTLRGTGEEEKLLKNAKTEYWNEAEEIATYTAIEVLAETVGDRETAQLARSIRREEERMQGFLERLIPQLTKAVARAEIPAAERNGSPRRSSRKRSTAKRSTAKSAKRSTAKRSTAKSAKRSSAKRSSSSRSSSGRASSSRSTSARKRSSSSRSRSSSSARAGSSSSARKRSGGSTARKRSGGTRAKSGSR